VTGEARATITLNRDELRERILGCWMGKNIGGTLGAPYEALREMHDVQGYSTPPGEPLPNDDLDLQLIWLKAVQERGPHAITAALLGEYWLTYIPPNWNEYGLSKLNQRAGISPPLSGAFKNEWRHSNGAWIRTEIWACLAPGAPDVAARFAYEDACVDHGDGEGTWAAMFVAALQSAAFVCAERDELLAAGLLRIPPGCRVARSVNLAIESHRAGASWQEARQTLVEDSSDLGWFQAPANVGFAIIGWLWGEDDFGKSIRLATNCGDDTDCTAATLGALFGIMGGRSSIPREWTDPIGDRVITLAIDEASSPVPRTVTELTDQVMALTPGFVMAHDAGVEVSASAPTNLAALGKRLLEPGPQVQLLWRRSPHTHRFDLLHTAALLDYGRPPVVRPGEPFEVRLSFQSRFPDPRELDLEWFLPDGWTVRPGRTARIRVDSYHTSGSGSEAYTGNPPPEWPPRTTVAFDLVPGPTVAATSRAVVQVVASGRPTVGLSPLVFLAENVQPLPAGDERLGEILQQW
jgi:ADP-ribosylglycohydrolase